MMRGKAHESLPHKSLPQSVRHLRVIRKIVVDSSVSLIWQGEHQKGLEHEMWHQEGRARKQQGKFEWKYFP